MFFWSPAWIQDPEDQCCLVAEGGHGCRGLVGPWFAIEHTAGDGASPGRVWSYTREKIPVGPFECLAPTRS